MSDMVFILTGIFSLHLLLQIQHVFFCINNCNVYIVQNARNAVLIVLLKFINNS